MKLKYSDKVHRYWLDGQPCKGVTSIAKIPDNTYYLDLWQKRQVAIGLASEPRLIEQVAAHLTDREKLDGICEEAQRVAKAHYAAEAGSTAHRFTEVADSGEGFLETELGRQIIAAWNAALDAGGYEVVDGMVERIAVLPDHRICGTFDRILRRKSDGRLFIADLKTGAKAVEYPHAIAVQLAVYANAPLLAGVLNGKGETTEFEPFPDVDKDVGIVIHMPSPERAELVEFDIAAGWDCFNEVILPTLTWRDRKDLVKVAAVELPAHSSGSAGVGVQGLTPAPIQRRTAIIDRIKALDDAGRRELARQWPDEVPTLKAFDGHTEQQLVWIEMAVIRAEAETDAPFRGGTGEPPVNRFAQLVADPFDGLSGEVITGPDEGGHVHVDDVNALKAILEAEPEVKAAVEAWASLAYKDGGRSLSLKQERTRWRYAVVNALLHAARAGCDDDGLRDLMYGATGSEDFLMPGTSLGQCIAALTIDQADRLAHLARHVGTDALVLTFSDKGVPSFSGSAFTPPDAA